MIPRLYAFEVSYCGVLAYSKMMKGMWPNIPAVGKYMKEMIVDAQNGMNQA